MSGMEVGSERCGAGTRCQTLAPALRPSCACSGGAGKEPAELYSKHGRRGLPGSHRNEEGAILQPCCSMESRANPRRRRALRRARRFPAESRSLFRTSPARRATRQLAGGRGAVPQPRKPPPAFPEGQRGSRRDQGQEELWPRCHRRARGGHGSEASSCKVPGSRMGWEQGEAKQPAPGALPGGFLLGNKEMSGA